MLLVPDAGRDVRPIVFQPAARIVSNWRGQAADHLDLDVRASLGLEIGIEPSGVSRCVRLNNYWCVKRAGWTGEIAADRDGHVAFSSAAEGAVVAAALLRRYYVDYGLHSAQAIVSRWAPAECGGGAILARGRGAPASGLAVRGVGNTLRARFLAARRGGARRNRVASTAGGPAAAAPALRRSVIPNRPLPALHASIVAVGLGTRDIALTPRALGGAAFGLASSFKLPPLPTTSCASETARIAAYARRAADGIAAGPTDDLMLFDAGGLATPHLAAVLGNMAAVEIGPLRPRANLVDDAVATMERNRLARAP